MGQVLSHHQSLGNPELSPSTALNLLWFGVGFFFFLPFFFGFWVFFWSLWAVLVGVMVLGGFSASRGLHLPN